MMLLATQTDAAIRDKLAIELREVESRFANELVSDVACVNRLVGHVERYRGKMLRPMLVVVPGLALQDPDRDVDRPLSSAHRIVATVVEMVHMATLVHDDILDEADVRRKGKTINALSGNEAAVMLGDYLISHAYHLCSSIGIPWVSQAIASTTNTVCEGELLQLSNRYNWELAESTYFEIIRRKTAILCGSSCRISAQLSDATEEQMASLYRYGESLGIAFQIVDDLLDLVGDEVTVGKTLGLDLQKGKLTLPLIRYLSTVNAPEREHMLALLRENQASICAPEGDGSASADVERYEARAREVRQLVLSHDSLEYAKAEAHRLIQDAKEALACLDDSPSRDLLAAMADTVLTRSN